MAASEINIYIHKGDATMKSNHADLIGVIVDDYQIRV